MDSAELLEEKKYLAMELQTELDEITNENIALRREIVEQDSQIRKLNGDIASTTVESLQINYETVRIDDLTREKISLFNEEHRDILVSKIDTVRPLNLKFEQLKVQREKLEEEVLSLNFENEEYNTEIIDINDRIDFLRAELPKKNSIITEKQRIVAEYRTRIADFERTIKKSNIAIGEIDKRNEQITEKDGGFQTKKRDISLLKKSNQQLEAEIRTVKNSIAELHQAEVEVSNTARAKSSEISNVINWSQEKDDFLQEIEEIKNEIKSIKSNVETSEKSTSTVFTSLSKCAPLITKWNSLLSSLQTPAESVQTLLSQLNELETSTKKKQKTQMKELESLMAANNKLEDDLNRKKAKISNFVELIKSDEIRTAEAALKERAEAKNTQQKLLKMIQNAKLDVLQCM